jgi:hypothetical protein
MNNLKDVQRDKTCLWPQLLLVVGVLLTAGAAYRVMAGRLRLLAENRVVLPLALAAFPVEIGDWRGQEVPIREDVMRVASNDDFLNRLYTRAASSDWVSVYIAYSARPRTMLGHTPQVCYVASGWIHDGMEPAEIITGTGMKVPCFIHRFHKPEPAYEERFVLSFYILNGKLIRSEKGFSGLAWRAPNLGGDPAWYVAQVQISSVLEHPVRLAAADMTELILSFLPDSNGVVRAAQELDSTGGSGDRPGLSVRP